MASRVQLKTPGSELVLTILGTKSETVGQTEYTVFSNGTQEIAVPVSSVKGRLERMGVAAAAHLVGKTVKFGRSVKTNQSGKPFWEMDIVTGNGSGAEQAPVPSAGGEGNAGKPASAPPVDPAADKPTMREAYRSLTKWVLNDVAALYREANVPFTGEIAAACTQTLFIQACYAGKVE